jgi:hypothetical protein
MRVANERAFPRLSTVMPLEVCCQPPAEAEMEDWNCRVSANVNRHPFIGREPSKADNLCSTGSKDYSISEGMNRDIWGWGKKM